MMWLRNIVTACLGGGDKEIGEYLEIGKDHDCGESFNAEGDFFLREGGVQRYPIGFPVCYGC